MTGMMTEIAVGPIPKSSVNNIEDVDEWVIKPLSLKLCNPDGSSMTFNG